MASEKQFEQTWWSEILRAGEGDPDALDNIARRYRDPILRFIRAKGYSKDAAEDLTQEVFLRLLRLDVLRRADEERGRFRSLLLTITERLIASHHQHEKAKKRGGGKAALRIDELQLADTAMTEHHTDEQFDQLWAKGILRRALADLRRKLPQYHEPLSLWLKGQTYPQIGNQLGCAAKTVDNRIHRARKKLREYVQKYVANYCSSDKEYRAELKLVQQQMKS